ncbi:MAG: biotin transporter BioY [Hyphomicrobiaceae bacterium]|nr:biotin transporter BioY [Hyphomicrobiaceae bacterium]
MMTATRQNLIVPVSSLPVQLLLVVAGSALLWLSAKVQVPFWPVPMTLQVLAVLGLAAALGARLGAATIALYLAEGAAGLPVFAGTPAKGLGISYMMGPTGGYLLGFLLAALFVGYFAERGLTKRPIALFFTMLAGLALIYAPGLAWLAQFTGWEKSVTLGFMPFILSDLLKIAVATLLFPAFWGLSNLLGRSE